VSFLTLSLNHFLFVGAILFVLGIFCIVSRRNAVAVLMGIELVINAANLNFIAFARYSVGGIEGHAAALFGIVLAAAEAAVGLAIVLALFRQLRTVDVEEATTLNR
jgi:NADH-quinone oxidoreductase subunit K